MDNVECENPREAAELLFQREYDSIMELAFLGEGETQVELIYNKGNENIDFSENISLGFKVSSVEEKMEFIKEKGLEVHSGPFKPNQSISFFFVLDPNGLKVQFVEDNK